MSEVHKKINEWRANNSEYVNGTSGFQEDPPGDMMYDALETLVELCRLLDEVSGHQKDEDQKDED